MVSLVAPEDVERSIPFALRSTSHNAVGRLGGSAPHEIRPRRLGKDASYFITVPLLVNPSTDLTVFLANDEGALLEHSGRLYRGDEPGPVEVVTHNRRQPSAVRSFCSELSERVIVLDAERSDWHTSGDGERTPAGRHKIGGRPAIFKFWDLEGEVGDLLRAGYRQVVQLDIPGPGDDLVSGSWPFFDGMFHLLAREPLEENDWVCFWEN
jgi:hypothetical protein